MAHNVIAQPDVKIDSLQCRNRHIRLTMYSKCTFFHLKKARKLFHVSSSAAKNYSTNGKSLA